MTKNDIRNIVDKWDSGMIIDECAIDRLVDPIYQMFEEKLKVEIKQYAKTKTGYVYGYEDGLKRLDKTHKRALIDIKIDWLAKGYIANKSHMKEYLTELKKERDK